MRGRSTDLSRVAVALALAAIAALGGCRREAPARAAPFGGELAAPLPHADVLGFFCVVPSRDGEWLARPSLPAGLDLAVGTVAAPFAAMAKLAVDHPFVAPGAPLAVLFLDPDVHGAIARSRGGSAEAFGRRRAPGGCASTATAACCCRGAGAASRSTSRRRRCGGAAAAATRRGRSRPSPKRSGRSFPTPWSSTKVSSRCCRRGTARATSSRRSRRPDCSTRTRRACRACASRRGVCSSDSATSSPTRSSSPSTTSCRPTGGTTRRSGRATGSPARSPVSSRR